MKKILLSILLLSLLALTDFAVASTDIIQLPGTVHTYKIHESGDGILDPAHPPPHAYDGDWVSYFDNRLINVNYNAYGGPLYSWHAFAKPYNISEIRFKMYVWAGAYATRWVQGLLWYYIKYSTDWGSTWNDVIPGYPNSITNYRVNWNTGQGGGQHEYSMDSDTLVGSSHTISGLNLVNVTNIMVFAKSWCYAASGWVFASASIYEIQAWGVVDIGLRAYDGTSVVKIACEPTGILTSPLRISKNGTTYAITLVDPTDTRASKIRIRASSGIKALKKY